MMRAVVTDRDAGREMLELLVEDDTEALLREYEYTVGRGCRSEHRSRGNSQPSSAHSVPHGVGDRLSPDHPAPNLQWNHCLQYKAQRREDYFEGRLGTEGPVGAACVSSAAGTCARRCS